MIITKAEIINDGGDLRYFDKEGNELFEGDVVRLEGEATIDGKPIERELYLTDDGELGTDATNPYWLETGRAVPCEYGIYPLCEMYLAYTTLIKRGKNNG